MAYNPALYYPQTYQPVVQQYAAYPQAVQAQPPAARVVEVIPVDSEQIAVDFPVSVGATVEFVAKDDSFVAFKSVEMNGQSSFTIYDKRPPAPPAPQFDPGAYVTWEALDKRLAALQAATGEATAEAAV